MSKCGAGVAMNNTVSSSGTPSTGVTITNPTQNTNLNNFALDDVQKLQQELQDMKEHVSLKDPTVGSTQPKLNI